MGALKKIIYNCRHATLLIEKRAIDRLTLRESIELRIHLLGCGFCRLFLKQSRLINRLARQLFHGAEDNGEARLDDEFKRDLQDRINDKLK